MASTGSRKTHRLSDVTRKLNNALRHYDVTTSLSLVQVLLNLWFVHHDDRIWEDPWSFKPRRFIEDGQVVSTTHPLRKQ